MEGPALSAAEEHLGGALPWEVWELYRFRNGQQGGGPYLVDRTGRVFLRVGLQLLPAADTVVDFIHALLR
ncbi:hypothetical protein WJX81_006173 [Elliptochloris bilobata]|uniref:Uncharacterized protein n=1 Tax=Elliptochloris bilobata TaxID=381761 RepID=A0AAW1R1L8_9CHLO